MSNKAMLVWHLFIDCPKCGEQIDLSDIDEEGWVSEPIFNNRWDDLNGEEVECPECDHTFTIDDVEY